MINGDIMIVSKLSSSLTVCCCWRVSCEPRATVTTLKGTLQHNGARIYKLWSQVTCHNSICLYSCWYINRRAVPNQHKIYLSEKSILNIIIIGTQNHLSSCVSFIALFGTYKKIIHVAIIKNQFQRWIKRWTVENDVYIVSYSWLP